MHISMGMTKSVAALLLLAAGCSSLNSASASWPSHCEYFDAPATIGIAPELPKGSAVLVCQSPQYRDHITIFSSIGHRDGVSYYVSLSFGKPDSPNATTKELVELTADDPYLRTTMMAFDSDSDLNHVSEKFIEAQFISIGTFKTLYTKWSSIVAAPKKHSHAIDHSSLDSESKGIYGAFIESLSGDDGWKISMLGFPAGDEVENSPRFEIEISGNRQVWSINFDVVHGKTIKLLSISEVTG